MQTIREEGDEDMRLDASFALMIDRPDRKIALESLKASSTATKRR